jgi:hypothetical protein
MIDVLLDGMGHSPPVALYPANGSRAVRIRWPHGKKSRQWSEDKTWAIPAFLACAAYWQTETEGKH